MEEVTLSGVCICVCVCVCTSMESLVQLLLFEAVESKELPAHSSSLTPPPLPFLPSKHICTTSDGMFACSSSSDIIDPCWIPQERESQNHVDGVVTPLL